MVTLFTNIDLSITVRRLQEDKIHVSVSSDFSGSSRKSALYVNEKRLADEVEKFWKSINTKKLLSMRVSFDEIDWYDDMTDIYETPIVKIQRGLKRAKVSYNEHGSIPKEWSVVVDFVFADTKANTPIMEVVKTAMGRFFTPKLQKDLIKGLKSILRKESTNLYVYEESE